MFVCEIGGVELNTPVAIAGTACCSPGFVIERPGRDVGMFPNAGEVCAGSGDGLLSESRRRFVSDATCCDCITPDVNGV